MSRIYLQLILCTLSDYLLVQITWEESPWNKEFGQLWRDLSWCKDKDNLGLSRGKGAMGMWQSVCGPWDVIYIFWKLWPRACRFRFPKCIFPKWMKISPVLHAMHVMHLWCRFLVSVFSQFSPSSTSLPKRNHRHHYYHKYPTSKRPTIKRLSMGMVSEVY